MKDSFQKILPQTNFVAKKFTECGYDADIIEILRPSLSLTSFFPKFSCGNYFCYLGKLAPVKGIDVLLKASKIAGDMPIKIIGDVVEREKSKRLAQNLKLQKTEFLGPKYGIELAEIIKNSICLVVPSRWYEVLGFIILEAFAWGKPVIGSDIGAIPEIVLQGKTGWLFPTNDEKKLAELLLRALNDKDKIEEMGIRARSFLEKNFSEENHYQNLIEAYKSIL